MRLLMLIVVLLMSGTAVPAVAGPLEDGGAAYMKGDYATALPLLWPLAEHGDARAQHWLGLMYEQGRGLPQDFAEAASWHRKAAEQGVADAQFNLGLMCETGQGVPQDVVQAHLWFDLAAAQDASGAASARDKIAEKMTPAQIAEAQKMAREWKPKQ